MCDELLWIVLRQVIAYIAAFTFSVFCDIAIVLSYVHVAVALLVLLVITELGRQDARAVDA